MMETVYEKALLILNEAMDALDEAKRILSRTEEDKAKAEASLPARSEEGKNEVRRRLSAISDALDRIIDANIFQTMKDMFGDLVPDVDEVLASLDPETLPDIPVDLGELETLVLNVVEGIASRLETLYTEKDRERITLLSGEIIQALWGFLLPMADADVFLTRALETEEARIRADFAKENAAAEEAFAKAQEAVKEIPAKTKEEIASLVEEEGRAFAQSHPSLPGETPLFPFAYTLVDVLDLNDALCAFDPEIPTFSGKRAIYLDGGDEAKHNVLLTLDADADQAFDILSASGVAFLSRAAGVPKKMVLIHHETGSPLFRSFPKLFKDHPDLKLYEGQKSVITETPEIKNAFIEVKRHINKVAEILGEEGVATVDEYNALHHDDPLPLVFFLIHCFPEGCLDPGILEMIPETLSFGPRYGIFTILSFREKGVLVDPSSSEIAAFAEAIKPVQGHRLTLSELFALED